MVKHQQSRPYPVFWRGDASTFLVADPGDVIQKCFVEGYFFDVEELEDLLAYMEPCSVVLDIGANIGNHTVFFAKYARARAVIPFEVLPAACELLRRNVQSNRLETVDLDYLGVGLGPPHAGRITVKLSYEHNLGATAFSLDDGARAARESFRIETLDHLLGEARRVDFIKLDVEGMELDVLAGAQAVISRWRPKILLESFGWVAGLRLLCWLAENNYRIEKTYGPNYLVVPLRPTESYGAPPEPGVAWTALRHLAGAPQDIVVDALVQLTHSCARHADLLYALGEVFRKLDLADDAARAYAAAEDAAECPAVALYQSRAELMRLLDCPDKERRALEIAATLTDDARICERLADLTAMGGDGSGAMQLMDRFLARNPRCGRGHHVKSRLAEAHGLSADALSHARLAAESDTPDKPNYMIRCADLTRAFGGSLDQALALVEAAIAMGEDSPWARQVRDAIIQSRTGASRSR
jgi:FkbM family methyltransferase